MDLFPIFLRNALPKAVATLARKDQPDSYKDEALVGERLGGE